MLLTRRNATSMPSLQSIQSAVNRLFDEAADDPFGNARGRTSTWAPPVDIYDSAAALVLVVEMPGFEKEDINIAFENGQLSFSGERVFEEHPDRIYQRSERWYGKFERTFQLPASVDGSKIGATLKNGILTVTVPKREEAKARQIQVKIE